jgi:iron(III) transport system ATP-binding protein
MAGRIEATMARTSIQGLCKHFKGTPPTAAADNLDLDVEEGEFLVLLGPSGCGKTTTLRCLAGLEEPDAGRISIGGKVVFDAAQGIEIAPDKRHIGMVFQSYALWPHLTVRKNIEYPLVTRKITQGLREGWAEQTARLVNCEALLERYPGQMSGGQQQRISLARGLVARPDLLLLDEPLSNLDKLLRDQVRSQLHELHQRLKFSAVFVTHDQSEALALGDRLAIMRSGRIEQLGTAREVFERPSSEYVANFIGMHNRIPLDARESGWHGAGQPLQGALPELAGAQRPAAVRVRAEDLAVELPQHAQRAGTIALMATVVDATFAGRRFDVVVAVGEHRFQAWAAAGAADDLRYEPGMAVRIAFRRDHAVFFDDQERRIAEGGALVSGVGLP